MTRRLWLFAVLSVLMFPVWAQHSTGSTSTLIDDQFDTQTVAEATVTLGCQEYCLTGICVWLVCTLYSCEVEYSEQWGHTSPDYVVSSYRRQGFNSWSDARSVLSNAAQSASRTWLSQLMPLPEYDSGMNYSSIDANTHNDDDSVTHKKRRLWTKSATVIGNPAIELQRQLIQSAGLYACPVEIDEGYPYFQSEWDALVWRSVVNVELLYPASYVPGLREIGHFPFNTWGSVHPRVGYFYGTEGPKVAAVMAQRAIDIVTRDDQPHVYEHSGRASDEDTDRWQMIHPVLDEECGPFGDPGEWVTNGLNSRVSPGENYGFMYWAFVKCCEPVPGALLGVIEIADDCSYL